jgi:multicomponent Na+:H+ antiporter subunit D
MSIHNLLPLLIILSALVPAVCIFAIAEQRVRLHKVVNYGGGLICIALICSLLVGVLSGTTFETRLPLLPGMDLVLHADALSLLFVSLSGLLWLVTTIYAVGYLKNTQHRSRFFGFFCLCVAATLGIALAGNLITFLIFYEFLTLATYPLVVHKGDPASLRAGRIYLTYTLAGGAVLLAGVVWLKVIAGPLDFTATGILSSLPHLNTDHLKIIFGLIIGGLGVKAALVPLHGWLPVAMAAPAPVSALLHAVAVVKAGAFGIIRVVYDVYGIEFARDLGLTAILGVFAAFTIVYGSLIAIRQNDIKKRLAYSTVSQVSYIALGTAIAGPIATIGGMVHLVHQGLMKITLFFCAGNLAETLGIHKVSELDGVGRRMPITMSAFTIAALGMIGLPPIAGFVSKWYLGTGAVEVGAYWVLGVLATSSLLNALYFLPIIYAAWFKPAAQSWPEQKQKLETHWMLLLPPAVTALLAIAAGVLSSGPVSPLSWVELIAAREYGLDWLQTGHQSALSIAYSDWAILTPLLFAVGLLIPAFRGTCIRLAPLAALPALVIGLTVADVMDSFTQPMLLLASLIWLVAGLYARDYLGEDKHLTRYTLCFLLCMSGSFGLTLSQDLFSFITYFTLMSFAAYGLVVHTQTSEALAASKTYIQWVIAGELILFAAMVGLAIATGTDNMLEMPLSEQPIWVSWFFVVGFGIKSGLFTLHLWLPLAHPVAPVPASALLSGLMVKAGLLGWMRFLPLGQTTLNDPGMLLVTLGLAGAFVGAVIGLIQKNPKTLLAYSTISQMGIIALGIGVGLSEPSLWPALYGALVLYAVHHGFAKTALFLSVGVKPLVAGGKTPRWFAWIIVVVPALAMAGLPFTSGALAKSVLKDSLVAIEWLVVLLPVTAIGTSLLMLRFADLLLLQGNAAAPPARNGGINSRLVACLAITLLVLAMPLMSSNLISGNSDLRDLAARGIDLKSIWSGIWPALTACAVYVCCRIRVLITRGKFYETI